VCVLGCLSVLPVWQVHGNQPESLAQRDFVWCWTPPELGELRALTMLLPMLCVITIVVAAITPTMAFVWSHHVQLPNRTAHYHDKDAQAALALSYTSGLRYTRAYARGAVIYLLCMLLLSTVPTFAAETYLTLAHGTDAHPGWIVMLIISSCLAGFISLTAFLFATFLVDPVVASASTSVQMFSPTVLSRPPSTYRDVTHAVMQRKPSRVPVPTLGTLSVVGTPAFPTSPLGRRSSRNRLMSTTGMEDVWQAEISAPAHDPDDSSGSSDDEEEPSYRISLSSTHLAVGPGQDAMMRRPSRIVSIGNQATLGLRRASQAVGPDGRALTWAERRRLLLEQQHAPAPRRNKEQPSSRTSSPSRVQTSIYSIDMEDPMTSER